MKMFSRMNFFFDDLRATEGEGEGEGETHREWWSACVTPPPRSLSRTRSLFLSCAPFLSSLSLSLSLCVCESVYLFRFCEGE